MSIHPIPEKKIYTLDDLPILAKISTNVSPKNTLPRNVVTLSSMKKAEEKIQLHKQMEEASRMANCISEASETIRLAKDNQNNLEERIAEALARNKRVINESQQFLLELNEEMKQLKSLKESELEKDEGEQEISHPEAPSTTTSSEKESDVDKAWYAKAYEGFKYAGEWSAKKVSSFFL